MRSAANQAQSKNDRSRTFPMRCTSSALLRHQAAFHSAGAWTPRSPRWVCYSPLPRMALA